MTKKKKKRISFPFILDAEKLTKTKGGEIGPFALTTLRFVKNEIEFEWYERSSFILAGEGQPLGNASNMEYKPRGGRYPLRPRGAIRSGQMTGQSGTERRTLTAGKSAL